MHRFSQIFPLMRKDELEELKNDIVLNGLLQPIILYEDQILDGRNRWLVCQELNIKPIFKKYDLAINPLDFVIASNLYRRHLTNSQKVILAIDLLPFYEEKAKKRQGARNDITQKVEESSGEAAEFAAKATGTNRQYIYDVKKIKEDRPDLFEKIKSGKKTIKESIREIAKTKRRAQAEEKGKRVELKDWPRLWNCDFRQIGGIDDESIDLILTDPPYPKEFLSLWNDLGKLAALKLKPGGYLIAYSGQYYLPEVFKLLTAFEIEYIWTFCLYHKGSSQIINNRNIQCRWKPILIFQRKPLKSLLMTAQDYLISEKAEKDGHDWQQSLDASKKLIEIFSQPGDIVCDPFMGTGTFVHAAHELKRKAIGAEIDTSTFNIAKSRFT